MKTVTLKQAMILRELGFNEKCSRYAYKFWQMFGYKLQQQDGNLYDNSKANILAVPTVDEAIDWLRRKFHIMIIDTTEPFVDRSTILYSYRVKHCNRKHGWNARKYVGVGKWTKDSYAAKRMAIQIALRYIKQLRKC